VLNYGYMQQTLPKLWIFVFLAVGAIIVAILLTGPSAPTETQTDEIAMDSPRSATFDQMLEKGGNAIYVENQLSDQSMVRVGFAVLSEPGYVVVFDDNEGVPGSVIGNSVLLEAGGEHFVVPVNKPLEEDQVYYALLYHDNGDGEFSLAVDTQALDFEESVILMNFIATPDSEPELNAVMP